MVKHFDGIKLRSMDRVRKVKLNKRNWSAWAVPNAENPCNVGNLDDEASQRSQLILEGSDCGKSCDEDDENFEEEALALEIMENVVDHGPGGRIWDAAVVMSTFLLANMGKEELEHKQVLEIGAGAGLVGIVCALLGGTVTMTDKDIVLPLMSANANAIAPEHVRRGLLCTERLEWGQRLSKRRKRTRIDYLLASDVLGCGDESLYPPLLKTLLQLCDADTIVLMAYKVRASFERGFFQQAKQHFQITCLGGAICPVDEYVESYHAPVHILRFRLHDADSRCQKQSMPVEALFQQANV